MMNYSMSNKCGSHYYCPKKALSKKMNAFFQNISWFQVAGRGSSLAVQLLGLSALTAEGLGSIPGWGSKFLQTMQSSQKKKK